MKYLFTIFFMLFSLSIFSQSICGFDEIKIINKPTHYQKNIEDQISYEKTDFGIKSSIDTFDLVFHIINLGEEIGDESNISDEQVISSLITLNRDFRALPIHDSISISPYGTDSEIVFRMACIDPYGNETTGINRVDASQVKDFNEKGIVFGQGTKANYKEITSLSNWPNNRYINIWVVHRIETPTGKSVGGGGFGPLNTQLFNKGYAGLYLKYKSVGCDYQTSNKFDLINSRGKAISHEMGHYFGLKHTFEGNSCNENDCETEGDKVCDTEPHDNSSGDVENCDEYSECGTREPVENLMNYAGKDCGNIFTPGQKIRMKETINKYLNGVKNQIWCRNKTNLKSFTIDTKGLRLYPNPILNNLNVISRDKYKIDIFNVFGIKMKSKEIFPGHNKINFTGFDRGVYFVKINSNQFSLPLKVIKN